MFAFEDRRYLALACSANHEEGNFKVPFAWFALLLSAKCRKTLEKNWTIGLHCNAVQNVSNVIPSLPVQTVQAQRGTIQSTFRTILYFALSGSANSSEGFYDLHCV